MVNATNDNISYSGLLETPEPPTAAAATSCQMASELFYVSNGRSLKVLSILCQGLVDDKDNPLIDVSVLPWSSAEKSSIKPTAIKLRAEVLWH